MRFKYVLFDLDGTLINTNKIIIDSFKYTLKKHLDLEVEGSEILKYFGEPLITTLERFSKFEAKDMYDTYIQYNESIHDENIWIFNNVDTVLKNLEDMGCIMAVVTSKRKALAIRGLKVLDLYRYFQKVIALEDTLRHKPNPDPILKALEELDGDKDKALMVGDSEYDIKCAMNAEVKSVLVGWSAAEAHQDPDMEPDYIIKDIIHLMDIVK